MEVGEVKKKGVRKRKENDGGRLADEEADRQAGSKADGEGRWIYTENSRHAE